jgi:tRNA 2-thiouridine synthesizing protein B
MRVFILTKSPESERTKLSFKLIARSPDAVIYLAGDAVYCLLSKRDDPARKDDPEFRAFLPGQRIFACQEDLQARGISPDEKGKAVVLDDFYERMVEDIMKDGSRAYSF